MVHICFWRSAVDQDVFMMYFWGWSFFYFVWSDVNWLCNYCTYCLESFVWKVSYEEFWLFICFCFVYFLRWVLRRVQYEVFWEDVWFTCCFFLMEQCDIVFCVCCFIAMWYLGWLISDYNLLIFMCYAVT